MKKFLFATVALLVAVGMAAPVMAEDRLSLSGSMQVRGFGYDAEETTAGVTSEDSGAWNDSRFRLGGKIAVADGVSVNFRMDAVESGENSSDAAAWGFNPNSAVATQYAQRRGDIQFDKAYLQFDKAGYTIAAGQMYFRQGMTGNMMDVVGAGYSVKKGAMKFQHVKVADRNEGNDSFDKTASPESSLTGLMYTIKSGEMTITPMLTYRQVSGAGDLMGLGLDFSTTMGGIGLKGAIEYFDGETVAEVDETGLNVYVDGSMKASDTLTVGAIVLYAAGEDTDEQVSHMNGSYNGVDYTFADFSPHTYGFNTTDFVVDVDPFEIEDNAGAMAFALYADNKFSDDLKGKFSVHYAQTDEDTVADITGMVLNASFAYSVAANTTLTLSANYVDADVETGGASDELTAMQGIAGLYVKF